MTGDKEAQPEVSIHKCRDRQIALCLAQPVL